MGFSPTGTMPVRPAAARTAEKNGVFCSSTPTWGGLSGSSGPQRGRHRGAVLEVISPAGERVLEVDTPVVDVDERCVARLRSAARSGRGSSRGVGQFAPDAQQLTGGAADSELRLLGRQEVPVHRVVGVDPDAAVDVHSGVGDAMPASAAQNAAVLTSMSAGKSSDSRHAACVTVSRNALTSM